MRLLCEPPEAGTKSLGTALHWPWPSLRRLPRCRPPARYYDTRGQREAPSPLLTSCAPLPQGSTAWKANDSPIARKLLPGECPRSCSSVWPRTSNLPEAGEGGGIEKQGKLYLLSRSHVTGKGPLNSTLPWGACGSDPTAPQAPVARAW